MEYFYPLFIYTGLGGLLLLLGVELIPQLHSLRKPLTAAWLTGMTLIWLLLPTTARWMISLWSPSAVLAGVIVMDLTPPVWWLGLALGVAVSATAWVELADRRSTIPLVGFLTLLALTITWLGLASGSLLATLATWAVLDLLVAAAGLMAGGEGERVTLGTALQGIASLLLWGIFLLLELQGVSLLWWLMRPSAALLVLLVITAVARVGLYPFHIILPRRPGVPRLLNLLASLGPLLGIGLLYRLLSLPGLEQLPAWVVPWGAIALLWGGLAAWAARETTAVLWATHALLGVLVAGAVATGSGALLMAGAAAWLVATTMLALMRGRDRRAPLWSWPAWLAVLFLLGVPPSPVGELYRAALLASGWGWRIVFLLGGTLVSAALLQGMHCRAQGEVSLPKPWQRVCVAVGLVLPLGVLMGTATVTSSGFSWLALVLWTVAVILAGAFNWHGATTREWFRRAQVLWETLDLQWFYRALWRGAENLLGAVRGLADVIEGNGALLWSLLFLLLILWVVMNR